MDGGILINDICAATRELRIACTLAQMEREGGISPRVSPLAQACYCKSIISWFVYLSVKINYILN